MCYKTANHPRWKKHHRRHHGRGHWKNKFAFGQYPPVNVEESDNQYEVQLFAAGYEKSDFRITLEDHILVIAVEKPNTETEQRRHLRQMQFKPGSFERRFELNDKIDTTSISAKYEAGVLKVALPKLEGSKTNRQAIEVD